MSSTGPRDLVRVAEDVAAQSAVAKRGDSAWLGHGAIGDEERVMHAGGHRACDQEQICVSRRGDHAESEALEVVVRAGRERELVLAAVA